MRFKILFIIILFLIILGLSPIFILAQEKEIKATYYEKALILDIEEITRQLTETDPNFIPGSQGIIAIQNIKLKILSGKFKGQEKNLENEIYVNPLNLKIKKGDKVIVYLEEFETGDLGIQVHDYYRLPQQFLLIGFFLILLLVIGKNKGLRAILSLIISIFLIFKIFIPQVLIGVNPIGLALIISAIITVITLLFIAGFKKKTLAAILGTWGGLLTATILAIVFGNLSRLTGLSSEEARILLSEFSLDFKGLLFSGIIITALGAVMDVAISVASGMAEIKKVQPEISRKKLIKSGMEIGRDIIGTMSNTLIFAYVGTSIFVLLLFFQYGESYLKFLNFDFVAEEIIGALSGSTGLILTIPLTAIIFGYFEAKK